MAKKAQYCLNCKRNVIPGRDSYPQGMHLLLTIFTCGLWWPIWLVTAASASAKKPSCPFCKRSDFVPPRFEE